MLAPFQLFAGHPVLDLVNTRDNRFIAEGPIERLGSYEDLLAFVRQSELLNGRRIGALTRQGRSSGGVEALRGARELREALAAVFYGALGPARKPSPQVIKTLERHFLDAGRHQELVWQRQSADPDMSSRARWDWGRFETSLELPVWVLAQSAASLLTSSVIDHVHMCTSETCRWLFLDSSKNHSRRWCNMKICGNRMKVRRWYQARREH
jgi:predicted RNA-binding Zn ribbon-like protein